jgi:hypothetical protein
MKFHPLKGFALALTCALSLTLAACDDTSSSNKGSGAQAPNPNTTSTATDALNNSVSVPALTGVASMDSNIYIVFDGSGSMWNCVNPKGEEYAQDGKCQAKIDGGRQALSSVVSKLPDEGVNLGLYVFDNNGRDERVHLGPHNRVATLGAVEQIEAGSGTPLGPSIMVAARALIAQYNQQLGYGTYRLIVVTDGMPDSDYDVRQALDFIKKSGVPISIYTIGFGMNDPHHPLRAASLNFTAAFDGGEVQSALNQAVSETETFEPSDFQAKK